MLDDSFAIAKKSKEIKVIYMSKFIGKNIIIMSKRTHV